MTTKTYYDILGVNRDASFEEIKQRRNKLAMKYHPDKLSEDEREYGESMIKEINEAYDTLSNPDKRKFYDIFGNNNNNIIPPNVQQQVQIDVTLEDIFYGKTIYKEIKKNFPCDKCNCTGFEDKQHHICDNCQGNGFIMITQQFGPIILQTGRQICNSCMGSGKETTDVPKCDKCYGKSTYETIEPITIDIDPGIKHGSHIIKDNIICIINELPHDVFQRDESNLIIDIELELHEALCGFVKNIRHIDNTEIWINYSDIIKDKDIKIIEGKGLPKANNFGDLIVRFEIIYPQQFSQDIKEKMYELLTGTSFDNSIYKIPDDQYFVTLKDYDDNQDANQGAPSCVSQ